MSAGIDEIELVDEPGACVLHLRGTISHYFADQLHDLALRVLARRDDAVVECRDAHHVGGAAMQILLALHHGLAGCGRSLVWRGASPAVARDLAWVGLRQG